MSDSEVSPSSDPRNVEQQHRLAKDLLRDIQANDAAAVARVRTVFPDQQVFRLADAQLVIAREAGVASWHTLVELAGQAELLAMRPLFHSGDVATLRKKLANSAFLRSMINAPLGDFGGRPLHMVGNNRAMIDLLLEFGADPNLTSEWANGPYAPIDNADEPTVRHLLSRGATLTPNVAARLGWLDELRSMLDADASLVHARGGDGKTPLHEASSVEIVDLLLSEGADINARCTDHHSTAAMYALMERPSICAHLIRRGAAADLYQAAHLGTIDLAKRLIEENPSALRARVNLDGYAPVPKSSIYCWTVGWYISPVQLARRAGHQSIVRLIESHQDPSSRLLDAAWDGEEAIARRIIEEDPDVLSRVTPQEHSLLPAAAHLNRPHAVKLMIQLGFDVNARANDGTTLHQACWIGHGQMVDLLLATGRCALNDRADNHRSAPLGWAAYGSVHCGHGPREYEKVIRALVAAGVDVRLPGNRHGGTIAGMAKGNPLIQSLLVTLGAG